MKKLILEELEDEELTMEVPSEVTPVELTPSEEINFHVSSITDLLNIYLEAYNKLNSYIAAPEFKSEIKDILESVSEDNALIIGKLQEALKGSSEKHKEDLINQGAEDAQEIIVGNNSEE